MFDRFLCFIGIHRWESFDDVHHHAITTYMRCVRSPNCRYRNWQFVNEEPHVH